MGSRRPKRGGSDRSDQETPVNTEQIAELQDRSAQGVLIKTLMHDYRLSKASIYRYLNDS